MTHALVLLCGGLSTRMGTNKAFLPFGEYTLIEYQVRRFRPNFEKIYLSVPKMTDFWMNLAEKLVCQAIPDRIEKIGPLGGLYSCLSAVSEDLLFFTPVDAPFTNTDAALTLCQTLEQSIDTVPEKYVCVLVHPTRGKQPLTAAYAKTCLPNIECMIQMENYRLRQLLTPEHTIIADILVPQEHFYNMNDMPSYYHALQMLGRKTACTVSCGFCPTNRTDNSLCLILCKIRNWKDNLSGKTGCLPERKRASYCTDQA